MAACYRGDNEWLGWLVTVDDPTNKQPPQTKKVRTFLSQYNSDEHSISFFEYGFMDALEYTSLELVKRGKYLLDNKK